MRLPGAERAIVDIIRLREYCLNPEHPRGKHKAWVFASALNMHQADAEFLRTQLLDAAKMSNAIAGEADEYGQRYFSDFECLKGTRRAFVRSAWIVLKGENFPRLATCYVL
jgi:glycerate-2-kinase